MAKQDKGTKAPTRRERERARHREEILREAARTEP